MSPDSLYRFTGQEKVPSPQLLYYPRLIRQNIADMVRIAGGADRLWPHIKTYKAEPVLQLLAQAGIHRFKCATIAEAELALSAGAREVLLAYPLVGPNIQRFLSLSRAYPQARLYAIADDTRQARLLGEQAAAMGLSLPLLLDIDLGQHRTGVSLEKALELYPAWSRLPGIVMVGLHCYDGHRHEFDPQARMDAVAPADEAVSRLVHNLRAQGLNCDVVIMGGTPSFPCHQALTDAYLSPGTCVIQDAGYRQSFPDLPFTPAAAVLTRVISHPTENSFTLDLGTKAVACDPAPPRAVVVGLEDARTVMHNEEHWVLSLPREHSHRIPAIGTELFAIPIHICPTTILYPYALAIEEGRISGCWPIAARDRKITL